MFNKIKISFGLFINKLRMNSFIFVCLNMTIIMSINTPISRVGIYNLFNQLKWDLILIFWQSEFNFSLYLLILNSYLFPVYIGFE